MGNHHQNGGRHASADDNRASWRPQDQSTAAAPRHRGNEDDHDYGSWRERNQDRPVNDRDPARWEGSRGSELGNADDDGWRVTEHDVQGQRGSSAGRAGEQRAQRGPNRNDNRNEMMRGSGSREDRDFGASDRFAGRGPWSAYDGPAHPPMDRNDMRGQGRGEPPWGNQMGGYDQHPGYPAGQRSDHERMGYQASGGAQGYGPQGYGGSQDDPQRVGGFGAHAHRGTGPHRGKGPLGYQRSDERLRELVSEALSDDDQIDASQIQVTVKDGEVTLSGIVDDRRTRREAEDCVANISGVRDVQIQLRVKDDRRGQGMTASTGHAATGAPATSPSGATSQGAGKHDVETSQDKKPRA
jgi:BON domain